ncbi:hypothetical protein NMG60_11008462 [Bertholletia excelsa]
MQQALSRIVRGRSVGLHRNPGSPWDLHRFAQALSGLPTGKVVCNPISSVFIRPGPRELSPLGLGPILIYSNGVAVYVLSLLVIFLTDVWKLKFKDATAIMNIQGGMALILQVPVSIFIDIWLGHFWMLIISSILYCTGLGLLKWSVPELYFEGEKICPAAEKECASKLKASPFYWALILIVLGKAGQGISLKALSILKLKKIRLSRRSLTGIFGVPLFHINWSSRFKMSACIMTLGVIVFAVGRVFQPPARVQGSALTNMPPVFLAAFLKRLSNGDYYFGFEDQNDRERIPPTNNFRCLNKAAIVVRQPSRFCLIPQDWITCTVSQVEETKVLLHMFPISATFLFYGMVKSMGDTFFLGSIFLEIPVPVFLIAARCAWKPTKIIENQINQTNESYPHVMKIGLGMLFGLASCWIASVVESTRLTALREHGLLNIADAVAPLSAFWLAPQFILIGVAEGLAREGMEDFFTRESPALIGLGKIFNMLFILILDMLVRRYCQRRPLDHFYRSYVAVGIINLITFAHAAHSYPYKGISLEEEEQEEEEPHQEMENELEPVM